MSIYSRKDGFERQWHVALILSRARATTEQLARQFGVSKKTVRRDLSILGTVFKLFRDRIGAKIYWTMSEEDGARRVRVLLRRAVGQSYPVIKEIV